MQNRVLLGIACLCLGVLVFSLQDALIKAISGTYPVTEALAIRALVALPILLVLVHADAGLGALVSKRMGFLTVRATILFTSYTAYYLAIAALPLADAVALYFMAPLIIMVLAGPYLGERRALADAGSPPWSGLLGVLVMLRPGAGLFDWAALLSLAVGGAVRLFAVDGPQDGRHRHRLGHDVLSERRLSPGRWSSPAVLTGRKLSHPSLEFLMRPWSGRHADFLMMAPAASSRRSA